MKRNYRLVGIPGMLIGLSLFLLSVLSGIFRFELSPFLSRGMTLLTVQLGIWVGLTGLAFFLRNTVAVFVIGGLIVLSLMLSMCFETGDTYEKQHIAALVHWGLCWIPLAVKAMLGS